MEQEYRIIIGGDLFPSNKNAAQFENGEIESLYDEKIRELFRRADFAICNLEGALTNSTTPIKKVDPIIKALPQAINGIKNLGVDCVTLANNHVLDFGEQGYKDTCAVLAENQIDFFGAGDNAESVTTHYTLNAGGKKVIFYAVAETMFNVPTEKTPGAHLYDEYKVCNDLRALKQECDHLIVLYHGGTEFFWYNSALLRQRFHRMADNGADIILAQHTHCIGIEERYNGAYLLYGQGDFLFARSVNEYKETGLLIELAVSNEGVQINRHLVRHVGGSVVYDREQNMDKFDERSAKFAAGERFDAEYRAFSDEKLVMFLEAFRGKRLLDKVIKKTMPKQIYHKYMRSRYTEKQVLRMISGVQFEEFRESVVQGLWNMVAKEK